MFNIDDLTTLYQLAQQADIKASQAIQVAALFQRCEAALQAAAIQAHMAKQAASAPDSTPPVA